MNRVALMSTSRADWNALGMVGKALQVAGAEVIVCTASASGYNTAAILADGFKPHYQSAARGAEAIVVIGDRHEMARATVDLVQRGQLVAHISGGDVTEGSYDDQFRNAISKMAHIHFPSCEESADRLIRMGEAPDRIFRHGAPAIDRILATPLVSRETLEAEFCLAPGRPFMLLNWQPETLGGGNAGLKAILEALSGLDYSVVAVGPNDDRGSQEADDLLVQSSVPYARNLAPDRYLSLIKHCTCMVGNSSSAFYEAPALGTLAINVGDRQKGRPQMANVFSVKADVADIVDAVGDAELERAILMSDAPFPHPYGDGHAAERIATTLIGITDPKALLRKMPA